MKNKSNVTINNKKDTEEKPNIPTHDSQNNQPDPFHLFADQLDSTSTEYREICERIFGYSATPQKVFTALKPKLQEIDSNLKRLTIYNQSQLKELSDRPSIGREERRFYSSLQQMCAEKQLQEPNNAVFQRIEKLFDLFPNAIELLEYVYDFLCLRNISHDKKAIYFSPVCICGNPGIGKTAVIRAICEALAVDYAFYDFSAASSSWGLSGQDSGWNGSHPGIVAKTLLYGNCANPIIHLDEIDKGQVNHNLDPYLALHTLLERPQMQKFCDAFAQNLSLNAYYVMFMSTANDIEAIPRTIRSRLRMIHIDKPSAEQMEKISANMYSGLLENEGVNHVFAETLDDDVIDFLSSKTPRETGLMLARGIAAAASRTLTESRYRISIDDLCNNDKDSISKKMGFVW